MAKMLFRVQTPNPKSIPSVSNNTQPYAFEARHFTSHTFDSVFLLILLIFTSTKLIFKFSLFTSECQFLIKYQIYSYIYIVCVCVAQAYACVRESLESMCVLKRMVVVAQAGGGLVRR